MSIAPLALAVLGALGGYLFGTASPWLAHRPLLRERLQALDPSERKPARGTRLVRPVFGSRLLGHTLDSLGERLGRGTFGRLLPGRGDDLARRLELVRPDTAVGGFYGECLGTAVFLGAIPCVAWTVSYALAAGGPPFPLWLSLLLFPGGFLWSQYQLTRELRERETRILMAMPAVLDLLGMRIAARESVQKALRAVATRGEDEFRRELRRALARAQLAGEEHSLPNVLEDMALRNGINEISVFVAQVRVNDQLGINILDTLTAQAENLREWKRQRIIEAGGKASTKIVIPLLLIVPVLFVLVLLPAVHQLMNAGL